MVFGPCTWKPGRRVPSCRGLRPFVVLLSCLVYRDFRWNGPIFCFTFSPAQWASLQLNGPVQHFCTKTVLTGPYWPLGRRRKKKTEPFLRKSLTNQTRTTTQQKERSPLRQPGTPRSGFQVHGPKTATRQIQVRLNVRRNTLNNALIQ